MRTKSAFKNVLASIAVQTVIAVCGFLLPRLLIETYGSAINGLVSTVKQMLTYFSVVSLGLGSASAVALYKPLAARDTAQINGVLSATRVFYNQTGYAFAGLVAVAAVLLPLRANESASPLTIASIVLICGAGAFCEHIVLGKYKVLLVADQKNYVMSGIIAQGVLAYTALSVYLIAQGASIILIQTVSTLAYLLRLLLLVRYIKRHYPAVDYCVEPDLPAIADRWEAFAYQLPGLMINYTPTVIIALFLGFQEASIYSVYSMIYVSLSMIVAVFSAGFSASFGNVLAQDERATLRKSFRTYEFIYRNVSFCCYACALILILPFVSVYVKNSDGVNYVLAPVGLLFSLTGLFSSLRMPAATLVEAAGRFKENKRANLAEALANVTLALALVLPFGMAGILAAAAVTSLVRSLLFIRYAYREILAAEWWATLAKTGANLILMLVLLYFLFDTACASFAAWLLRALRVFATCFGAFALLNVLLDYSSAQDVGVRLKMLVRKDGATGGQVRGRDNDG